MSWELAPAVRSRAEIEAAYQAGKNHRLQGDEFVTGVNVAHAWLLGYAPSPISLHAGPATLEDIIREENVADDAIYQRAGAAGVSQRWAVGVQHALMWARGQAQSPLAGI